MKSAEEIIQDLCIAQDLDGDEWPTINTEEVRSIVRDALLHCAQICRRRAYFHNPENPETTAEGECARAIEASADTLK